MLVHILGYLWMEVVDVSLTTKCQGMQCLPLLYLTTEVPFLKGKLEILGMTAFVVLIFTSRAITDFLEVFDIGVIPTIAEPCVSRIGLMKFIV